MITWREHYVAKNQKEKLIHNTKTGIDLQERIGQAVAK